MPTSPGPFLSLPSPRQLLSGAGFVVAYVLLDWISYYRPMYGLNITPWSPALALGLVYWLQVGKWAGIPWFAAICIGEVLLRDRPLPLATTLGLSAALVLGYGLLAETLRRYVAGNLLYDRQRLLRWVAVVTVGTLLTSSLYIALLLLTHLIPADNWAVALAHYWIGDYVGIIVTMPFFWLLLEGKERLGVLLLNGETAGYILLSAAMLWISFAPGGASPVRYFYLLFLPIVWAAARQGVPGAAVAAFSIQAGIIVAVRWQNLVEVTVFELQMRGAVLAFVGLFIGVVGEEKQRIREELRQTLRLAAAGEMAAALAHELNQPLTALSAYGAACEHMLEQGESGERLKESIRRMVAESFRAADVVRRLRDFFRTGATKLEEIELASLLQTAVAACADKAKGQGVALTLGPVPSCILLADRMQLEIVLRNLLSNAMDSVAERPADGRRIRIAAKIDHEARVCVEVEDSGPGLSAAAAARLFEAFQSSKASGMGLGLAISRAIVEAHGGRLWAEARPYGLFKMAMPIEEMTHDDV